MKPGSDPAPRTSPRRSDLSSLPQHVYPKRLLSSLMYRATRVRYARWKNWQIRWFIKRYGVDMGIAVDRHETDYLDFNTFFTRPLTPGSRPVEGGPDSVVAPADGVVSQAGTVERGTVLQAKGRRYAVDTLLGRDGRGDAFEGGAFMTVYLSPRDYHRVHMPVDGELVSMTYVPGALFSVNPATASSVRDLFARNERVVSIFDTALGPLAMVMVGAVFVGGIEQVWCGAVTPPRGRSIRTWEYTSGQVRIGQGEEFGRFNMGSTVVMLLGNASTRFESWIEAGEGLCMGQRVARVTG